MIGVICVAVSFIFFIKIDGPEKSQDVNVKLSERQKEDIKTQISAVFREQTSVMTQTVEGRTRDALEKLSNQKINELAEYSDTVLGEINKNHSEVMFLYDMLNNKHANIKDTVSKVDKAVKAAEDKVKAIDDTPAVKTEETEKVIPADEPAKTEEAVSPEIGFMGETAEEGQNNNEKILEMHRQGKSTVAIARELGLGVGEVKLVIDLYKA